MLLQLSELLARTSWLITALVLAGCAAQPAPDCRTPETCPPLVALPDQEPGLQTFQPAAHVSVDLTQPPSNISDTLFGLFFEEILHGGEGGLYAELVQDRGFEGLAYASGYAAGQLESKDMTHFLHEWPLHMAVQSTDPRSWAISASTKASISRMQPRDRGNPTYLTILSHDKRARLSNHGFWGIPVQKGASYELSLYLRASRECKGEVEVALTSADLQTLFASTSFVAASNWTHHTAALTADAHDPSAVLVIQAPVNCSLDVDVVSLFPAGNGRLGVKTPFRPDLLNLLKGLHPKFIRLPGGCYVEGTRMSNAYLWKPSVGPLHQRPGHWNGQWQYWSTDGLGLYEYMLLAEALQAQPIWVINNGLAHEEGVPTSRIAGMVQDALDALDFIMGPSNSTWGAVRAGMGHPEPWSMRYLGIGNEDCGKQFYAGNYLAFYRAIKQCWPHLQLIANCDMREAAPTDIYDWHWYTAASSIFHARATFDAVPRGPGHPQVFASEYAVFDWGHEPFRPYGNMEDAVGEAGFMTGLEQNADVVRMAAFAPLLTNIQHPQKNWAPNTLISFDGSRTAVSPSYHVQALFAEHAGPWLAASRVNLSVVADLAVSVTCSDAACKQMACKMANWGSQEQPVKLLLEGAEAWGSANATTLASPHRLDTNSLDEPNKVAPVTRNMPLAQLTDLRLPAASLTIITLQTTST